MLIDDLNELLKDKLNNKLRKRIEEVLSQLKKREKLPLEERKKDPLIIERVGNISFYFLGKKFLFAKSSPFPLETIFYFKPVEISNLTSLDTFMYEYENYEECMIAWLEDDDDDE